jgi:sulfotransferase
MREIFYVSGLPRSGSTLLMSLLAQHPIVKTTPTSGLHDLLFGIKGNWNNIVEHKADKASGDPENLKRVLSSTLYSYHNTDKPVIVDKSRAWVHSIEMIESITGKRAKIICPVRNITNILSSFERLYRRGSNLGINHSQFQNTEERINHWASNMGEVGSAYNRLRDVFTRGLQDRLCLVEYDSLVGNPEYTMKEIWKYLGMDCPDHDFNNVDNPTPEDDSVYGYIDLHTIRPKVFPNKYSAESIIGSDMFVKYSNSEFWRS